MVILSGSRGNIDRLISLKIQRFRNILVRPKWFFISRDHSRCTKTTPKRIYTWTSVPMYICRHTDGSDLYKTFPQCSPNTFNEFEEVGIFLSRPYSPLARPFRGRRVIAHCTSQYHPNYKVHKYANRQVAHSLNCLLTYLSDHEFFTRSSLLSPVQYLFITIAVPPVLPALRSSIILNSFLQEQKKNYINKLEKIKIKKIKLIKNWKTNKFFF